LNMASNIALGKEPVPVGIFSLEMSSLQLGLRILCSEAEIDMTEIRDGLLSNNRWIEITNAADKLRKAPLYIEDSADLNVVQLRAKARRMKEQHDIKVLIIDYLQLLKPVGSNKNSNREQDVSQMSGGLKSLAKELDIPVVVLAQLNRQAETTGQKPKLSQLRESGAIEQDADVVALLHRERVTDAEHVVDVHQGLESELIIAKHRNGPCDVVKLMFFQKFTRFRDKTRISDEDVPDNY